MNYPDPETVPPVWQIGDVILDRYEVQQIFTSGGMGLVYRADHRGWGMALAVKSPRPEFLQTAGQIESFEREAETWVNLGLHPHIVSLSAASAVSRVSSPSLWKAARSQGIEALPPHNSAQIHFLP